MTDSLLPILMVLAALGCGLNAGVFFAFSSFVMPALAKLPAAQGIAAMQAINVAAVNRWFMTVLFGTGLLGITVAGLAVRAAWPDAGWLVLAGLLHPVGTIAVTMAANVPLNNRLARVAADSAEGAMLWSDYLKRWTAWNHVRALSALAAMALLICWRP